MPKEELKKSFAGYLLQLFQATSLDVVIGAVAGGVFAVNILAVKPNFWWWPVLIMSVWVVYTSDHLIDGFHQKRAATIFRHRLHYRFRYFFMAAIAIFSLLTLILVLVFLDIRLLLWGIAVGFGALIYLGFIILGRKKGFYFQKEFFISLFYVIGIWLAPLLWYGRALPFTAILTMAIFVLLVWAEGLLTALYEREPDRGGQMQSFCTFYGQQTTQRLILILLILSMLFSLGLLFSVPSLRMEFLILIIMTISLMAIHFFPSFFQKNERYRTLGELTFWFPFLLLL
ncbi:hypothetical protein MNBD_BACTEROID07-1241 [hydrothermal vent metagenome]|uniref:UbiA prenyltransferase family protein n=1 Tax=hydrothermal vent metagenome TaxID=652676 RepID=A0A3B0UWZ9_9ZZZZ